MTVLLTGAVGFIGYHVSEALLARGERVIFRVESELDPLPPLLPVTLCAAPTSSS